MKKTNNLIIEKAYINGKWEKGKKKIAVINPADNKIIAEVADLSVKETQTAIKSAHKAWLSWRHETAQYRCDLLSRFDQLINENKDDIAEIITLESGKPIRSEEHTSELQSRENLVCRLLLEKKKI